MWNKTVNVSVNVTLRRVRSNAAVVVRYVLNIVCVCVCVCV
jgi:hypothetical protein